MHNFISCVMGDVMWCGVAWRGAAWCGVVCDVMWCDDQFIYLEVMKISSFALNSTKIRPRILSYG